MILIPSGTVQILSGTVQLGAEVYGSNDCDAERKHHDCDAELKHHSYKCHPRFGTIEV